MGNEEPVPKESDPLLAKGEPQTDGWDFGLTRWCLDLKQKAGFELLVILFFSQHLGRGVVDQLCSQSTNYVYRLYHVPASKIQIYEGIRSLPWAMKPMVGLISDVFPIGGYNKAPYMVMATVLGTVASGCVGVIPTSSLMVVIAVACFAAQSMQLATNDLLTEAKYAVKIREFPEIGPSMMTYVWFGMTVGGIIGIVLAGALAAHIPKMAFTIGACLSVPILVPIMMGYMQERRVDDEELRADRQRFAQEWEAVLLTIMMFVVSVSLSACGLATGNATINGCVAITATCCMLVAVLVLLKPIIGFYTVFSMLQPALTLSTSGASFYFMVDKPEQFPEGPHFSEFFYTSVTGTVAQVVSLMGIACYQRYMTKWRYRSLFIVANVVYMAVTLLDIVFYTRLNVRLGIPDHVFLLSTTVLQNLIFQWQWMPQVVLLSYLCPSGMEATMYSLLAGCHNLGVSVSSTIGAFLLKMLKCQPNGSLNESAQFDHLWMASAISSVLPLITVVVLIRLVPDGAQGEKLIEDHERSATEGSLWRRWTSRDHVALPSV